MTLAGIEKVCERSGDYPGHLMYKYKRASIQVCPQYRKEFKGQKHVLFIFEPEVQYAEKRYPHVLHDKHRVEEVKYFHDDGLCIDPGYGKYWIRARVSKEYYYLLYVPDIPGQVDGKYVNWSRTLGTVKRKISRLIGGKYHLNIVRSEMTWGEYCKLSDEERKAYLERPYQFLYSK